jgi:hypothetical protein
MGSLAQTKDAWVRLLELLNLKSGDLELYDIDPKPSFADHVTFLPKQLKSRAIGEPLRFLSGFFYDLGYWAPVTLAWYMLFVVMPQDGMKLGSKVAMAPSIVVLVTAVPATFFAIHSLWRRHLGKWVESARAKRHRDKP